MCLDHYFYFAACQHYGIEVRAYCEKARWLAAMTGTLYMCRPYIFNRRLDHRGPPEHERPREPDWEGVQGFCRQCVQEHKLPDMLYQPTHTNHRLPDLSPALFDPKALAPHIYLDEHTGTIPELLGVEEMFQSLNLKEGPRVYFPPRLEQSDWECTRASVPFANKGMWEFGTPEELSLKAVHERLGMWMGTTDEDREAIRGLFSQGGSLRGLYMQRFSPRGMPLNYFDEACAILTGQKDPDYGWLSAPPAWG